MAFLLGVLVGASVTVVAFVAAVVAVGRAVSRRQTAAVLAEMHMADQAVTARAAGRLSAGSAAVQ